MSKVPEPEDLRKWIAAKGMTVSQAAKLAGVEARAARRWTSPREAKSFREIPWSAWALMRILSGEATPERIRQEIED